MNSPLDDAASVGGRLLVFPLGWVTHRSPKISLIQKLSQAWDYLKACMLSKLQTGDEHGHCVIGQSYSQKTSQSNHTMTTALSNSMKLSHVHGATQDGRVMVEKSDRMWSTGEGNDKPLQYSCLENPMNNMKRQNDRILKEKLRRSVGAQYATGDQWRNNSRKNEGMEPKQKQYPAVDMTGDRSKVRCCKEQYCI